MKKITVVATGAIPWRPPDIVYKKNELWVDVVERMNLLVSAEGTVLRSDVDGAVHLKCQLSGMPQCEFGLNDKVTLRGLQDQGKEYVLLSMFSFEHPIVLGINPALSDCSMY